MRDSTIHIIRGVYESFGKQDIPAILERLSPDIEWEYGPTDARVPYLAPRKGPKEVGGFFQAIGEGLAFERFEVRKILGDESTVIAICAVTVVVKKTGTRITDDEELHVWHFDANGRVTRFRHAVDVRAHTAAHGL
jgi:uncharacterized protein